MRVVLTSILVFAASGCFDDATTDDTASTSQSVVGGNSISFNRIATNRIATNRIATNRIATNRIATNRFQLDNASAGELIDTADGRELLTYVVSCALPQGVTLEGQSGGTTYTFPGSIGLASQWTEHALEGHEQRWVSSCLLARVNAHGISLLISLRGPNSHLKVTDQEDADYTLEEGAFYGNIFTPPDQPIIAFACMGRAQAAGEPTSGPLKDRDCTEPVDNARVTTQCGFAFTGDCADFASISHHRDGHHDGDDGDDDRHDGDRDHRHTEAPHACEDTSSHGYYKDCHTEESDNRGHWPSHTKYDEVITVYVAPQ